MTEKTLPPLYSIDANNKERIWSCKVVNNIIYREYGTTNGKRITSERQFKGKSIGKRNETTPEEQAWLEANKEWVKYIDKGYRPSPNDKHGLRLYKKVAQSKSETGGHNVNTSAAIGAGVTKNVSRKKEDSCIIETSDNGVMIPMKAQVWEVDHANRVKDKVAKYFRKDKLSPYRFYCQPKLDGWRAIIRISSGNVLITSNSGKQYPWFKTLRDLLRDIDLNILDGLDGELYALDLKDGDGAMMPDDKRFSTICSICGLSRTSPHEYEDQIQFHVFDLVDKSGKITQDERFNILNNFFSNIPSSLKRRIVRVPVHVLDDVNQVPEYHDVYANKGYEGVVLRSFDNFYKLGKRSNHMRKYKNFLDEEYKVVGCKLDEGVSAEHFVWVLETDSGQEFSAKPMGTRKEKMEWYDSRKSYIGKWLTIKFQEYSDDGIPRFPIAKGFRANVGED